jgi:hypothetical protein
MKATFDLPDDLYRRVKAMSALEGRPVRDIAIELFGDWLAAAKPRARKAGLASAYDAMKPYLGVVASGTTDLGSNPRHLDGFGKRRARHR